MNTRAIGLDIGGTKIAAVAVDATGRVHARATAPTEPERGFAAGVARLTELVEATLAQAGWSAGELRGVGVGCTGPVDPRRGTVHNPFTLPTWDDGDLVTPLAERFGVPVWLENDADAAALGEAAFGAGRGANPVVMLTAGTGVGGGVIADGRLLRGLAGEHPELGHIHVAGDGPPCYCGTAGCFESLASGTAIGAHGRAFGFADARAVFRAAGEGDVSAAAVVARVVEATATACWTVAHCFVPERLVLGGGVFAGHFDLFADPIRRRLAAATAVPARRVVVCRAELGADAGAVGAACLALFESPRAVAASR